MKIDEFRLSPGLGPLQQLPEFDPDPALWDRIEGLRTRHVIRRRRRHAAMLGGSIAATLFAVLVFVPGFRAQQAERSDVLGWQRESLTLEEHWRESSGSVADPRTRAQLQMIDAQLQAAYDQAAAANVLIPLWKQRNQTLQELIEHDSRGIRSITRI